MIKWHLNYTGPKCIDMQDGTVLIQDGQNQEIDPLVLANGNADLDLNHNIVVLDPVNLGGSRDDGGRAPIVYQYRTHEHWCEGWIIV